MKTIVFSDVHLNVAPDGRPGMDRFVAFLRGLDASGIDNLIILGDLFDFWFEYRSVVFSGYFDVLRAFADLRDGGVKLYFVCGNHDFWAGRFLRDDLDMTIAERLELEVHGRRTLFVHGDGVNPKDVGYRIYKRIARFPLVVGAFRLLHPDWAMGIAQFVSRSSRHLLSTDDPSEGSEVAPLRGFAKRALEAGEADVVMCGHSHYPVHETFPTPDGTGDYFNTGDWLFHQSYVEWDGDGIRLRRWEPGLAEVEPGGEAESAPDQGDQQHHE